MRELSAVCLSILNGNATPQEFRNFAARAVNAGHTDASGRGVDPTAAIADDYIVQEWVRRIVLVIPHLRAYHGEARAWLERRSNGKPLGYEGRIPFNICLGGEVIV